MNTIVLLLHLIRRRDHLKQDQDMLVIKICVLERKKEEIKVDLRKFVARGKFHDNDMKTEFTHWFESKIHKLYIDNDPSCTAELFDLACGPSRDPISVNSCVVNGVRFVVHIRDQRRTTQNSRICSPSEKDEEMYCGQLEEILSLRSVLFEDQPYILATQAKKYSTLKIRPDNWKVIQDVNNKKFSNGDFIGVLDDHYVIHDNNSSDLALISNLNDLDFTTLDVDGQSTKVKAPPPIIPVDEEDDFIDDEDDVPHD
ncbi:hypothetical protein Tco_1549505 [Tanacetum coccineum]